MPGARPEQEEREAALQPLLSMSAIRSGNEDQAGEQLSAPPREETEQKPSESQSIRNLSAARGPPPTEPPRGGGKLSSTFPLKSALITLLISWVQPTIPGLFFLISNVTVFSTTRDTVYLLFSWKARSVTAYTKSCQNKGVKIEVAQGTKNWTKLSSRRYGIYQPRI